MGTPPTPERMATANIIALAKCAEQAERYEDMVAEMKKIVSDPAITGDKLENETRNLISVGYKNVMSARHTSWRVIQAQEEGEPDEEKRALLTTYKETVAAELYQIIQEVSNDIVKVYTEGPKAATKAEIKVFFHKLDGDYNRYGAEASSGDKRETFKDAARSAYEKADALCKTGDLHETNPIRLGLALNFSVFYYEIDGKKDLATEIAEAAFDNAIDKLDCLGEDEYRDSTLIMQLLKDNLSLWQSAPGEDPELQQ